MQQWTRVTRANRCPCCGKDSWCEFTPDMRRILCMRVESQHQAKSGGWFHPVANGHAPRTFKAFAIPDRHPVALNPEKLLSGWRSRQQGELERFAATLNVTEASLRALGCVWAPEHRAFAFPMLDAQRRVTGIRLRNDVGDKWAVTGSKQGLFLNLSGVAAGGNRSHTKRQGEPETAILPARDDEMTGSAPSSAQTLLIVEGPTDAAAAIDLGYDVIGRPACLGCEQMIADVVAKHGHVTTLIIADADTPGQRGAEKLQAILRRAKIITLPAKDLRAFKSAGGTRTLFEQIVAATVG